MQADRRSKLAPALLMALVAAGAGSSGAQTTPLRPPSSGLGSGAKLGPLIGPAASPANSPAMSTLQNTPALAPHSAVTPQSQTLHPQDNIPDARKLRQVKLPQRTLCLPGVLGTSLSLGGPNTVTLVCNVPDQPTQMEFMYAGAQLLQTLQATNKSGFSLQIDYEDQTPVSGGNTKRQLMMVGAREAYLSHMHVVCLPVGNRNLLSVGPRNGEPYPQITTFCTDGQRVTPVTFVTDKNSFGTMHSAVEDGPLAIDYQLVMGGRDSKTGVVRPYPIQRISKLPPFPPPGNLMSDAKHAGDSAIAGMAVRCSSSYVGRGGAAGCTGNIPPLKVNGVFQGPEFSAMEYRTFFTDAIASAQNVTVPPNNTKTVSYTLMPGVVPPEYRNATQGACRVALYSAVVVKPIPQKAGLAYSHPKDEYCRKFFANTTAVWRYSYARREEICFPSQVELRADHKIWEDKQPGQASAPPPPPADTCKLLPR